MTLDRLEISTERRPLPGRTERRGSYTGFPSAGAYLFGAVFVAVGAGVALVGLRVIPVNPQGVHAPWWAFATDSPWMVKAITVVFDLLLVLIWIEALRRVGVAVKFGGSRVEFTRFPYEVGGVTLDLPGLDFDEIYLVPVYGR